MNTTSVQVVLRDTIDGRVVAQNIVGVDEDEGVIHLCACMVDYRDAACQQPVALIREGTLTGRARCACGSGPSRNLDQRLRARDSPRATYRLSGISGGLVMRR